MFHEDCNLTKEEFLKAFEIILKNNGSKKLCSVIIADGVNVEFCIAKELVENECVVGLLKILELMAKEISYQFEEVIRDVLDNGKLPPLKLKNDENSNS